GEPEPARAHGLAAQHVVRRDQQHAVPDWRLRIGAPDPIRRQVPVLTCSNPTETSDPPRRGGGSVLDQNQTTTSLDYFAAQQGLPKQHAEQRPAGSRFLPDCAVDSELWTDAHVAAELPVPILRRSPPR